MATDYATLTGNLSRFYDFTDKIVLFVGAGRRQLLDPAIRTRHVIAIDQDAEALQELRVNVAAKGMQDSVDVMASAFEEVTLRGDVVYFEFCLHEMADPSDALKHARALAPDIVVFDHSPGSDWAFHAAEEDLARRSAEAMERFGIRRREAFSIGQFFGDFAELLAKVSVQGDLAIERATVSRRD